MNNTKNDGKTEKTNKWDNRELGALWLKVSKDKSQKYMTGHIQTSLEGKIDVVVFSNKDKKSDKSPDFRVYISDKKATTENAAQPTKAAVAQTQDDDSDVL